MNNTRTVCIFFLFFILNRTVTAQNNPPAGPLTLQKAVETAIANNLDVQQNGLVMERSKIDWNQARLNIFPSFNGSGSIGLNQGRNIDQATNTYINTKYTSGSYGLNSDVVLFNGLAMQNAIKQTALAYEASKMDWQQAKDNITISIILAYLQVLSNEDLLVQSRNQLAVSKNEVARLTTLNDEGAIQPSQLSDLKGQYANDQLAIINTQNSLESAKINLCQFMNIPYDKNLQLERISAESYATKYEQTPDSIYQVALQQFSLIRAADLRRQSAEKAVKAARGQLYPTLSLNGSVSTQYSTTFLSATDLGTFQDHASTINYVTVNGTPSPVISRLPDVRYDKIPFGDQFSNNRGSYVGLSLRVPIFNSFQQRNRVKLAQLSLKNNELAAQTSKTQLQQSIEQAYANMTAASDRYKVLLEQVTAYAESFRAAEIRFNAGLGTSVDYLTAKNNLDRANISVITEKYNYVLRTKILDYYQGKKLW